MGASFTSVKSTVSPSVTRSTGPGTRPSNVQPSYVTPSAIVIFACRMAILR